MNCKKIIFFLVLVVFTNLIFAQNLNNEKSNSPFELSLAVDIPLGITSLTTFALSQFIKQEQIVYNPNEIRNLNSVNSFDRWMAQPYSKNVDITSDVLMYLTLCTPFTLFATNSSEYLTWGTMYLEAFTLAFGLKDLIKLGVYRERPYMYFENKPMEEITEGDYHNSFLSGHTTLSFMGASFGSYVFSKYFPESKWKVPVIMGSFSLAAITSSLRMIGGCHFLSDVLAGATLGTVVGIGVPFLHELNSIINRKINNKIDDDKIEQASINLLPNSIYCVIKL